MIPLVSNASEAGHKHGVKESILLLVWVLNESTYAVGQKFWDCSGTLEYADILWTINNFQLEIEEYVGTELLPISVYEINSESSDC